MKIFNTIAHIQTLIRKYWKLYLPLHIFLSVVIFIIGFLMSYVSGVGWGLCIVVGISSIMFYFLLLLFGIFIGKLVVGEK
jgi:hypothetical protein